MTNDQQILRRLAFRYAQLVQQSQNAEKRRLHTAVNDRRMIRPVVLIDELPWNEMNINDELAIECQDPYLKNIEWFFKSNIYKYTHLPADMLLRPYVPIDKIVHSTGIGLTVEEETLARDQSNSIVSHAFADQLPDEEALEQLHAPVLTYDEEETLRRYNLVGSLVGDILPVKVVGRDFFFTAPWDDIAVYRGVSNLLMDLIENPELSHKMVRKFTEIRLSELEQMERLGLFENDPYSLHCTPVATDDLSKTPDRDGKLTRKNIWGRGAAQIFTSVSAQMTEEFDIEYMKQTIGTCGLSYYGCCEALDKKIDVVSKLPNLRKISISPWADVENAAQVVGDRYVLSVKPNPASVAWDDGGIRRDILKILDAGAKNGCSLDIVLKDISTCNYQPEAIFNWEKTVMDIVTHY